MNLIQAGSKGDLTNVKKLTSEGANINATDSSGRSALIEAAWGGHNDVVKFLIEKGADVNISDNSGYTALMRAAESGKKESVALLVQKKADVNIKGKVRGTTALMLAAEQGHVKIIELLLEHGAIINDHDQYEETALARALKTNQTKAAEFLEEKGGRGKPDRNTFTYNDKEARPVTKATIPQWSAAANEGAYEDESVGPEESFDDE